MADQTVTTTLKINDAFSSALSRLSAGLKSAQGGFGGLKSSLVGAQSSGGGFFKSMLGANLVGSAITKSVGMVANGAKSMIGELDEAQTAWATFEGNMKQIGQSPKRIASAKSQLQEFAQQTIYSASDMSSTYSQLASVGVKNVTQLVKGFGGLASSATNPAQAMKSLSQQATQMAAKPKVQWQDFKIMMEQAPAGMSAVAKSMGMSLQQMISKISDGKVKTQDFLDAVAKVGTNKNFSKMATQYKTIGDAFQGFKETLSNGMLDGWQAFSKGGIKAVEAVTDALGSINFKGIGKQLSAYVSKIDFKALTKNIEAGIKSTIKIISNIGQALGQMFQGFKSSGALDKVSSMFDKIGDSAKKLSGNMSDSKSSTNFFKQLGSLAGSGIGAVADTIANLAEAVSKLKPDTLQALATAFTIFKAGTKGIVFTALIAGLNALSKVINMLPPDVVNGLGIALGTLAMGITAVILAFKSYKGVKGFFDMIKGFKKIKTPEIPQPKVPTTPEAPNPSGIVQNAGAYLKLAGALALVGGATVLVGFGFKLIADSAIALSNAGGGAIAVFFGMIGAITALAVVVRFLGAGLIEGSIGFIIFAGALLMIGVAIAVASAGLALLATQLPTISQYGVSASVGLLALAGAVLLFGVASIVGAVGAIALGAGLIVLGAGALTAGIGALVLGAGLLVMAGALRVASPAVKQISDALSQLAKAISGGIAKILDSIANVIRSIGDSAYNAGLGISMMADGLQTMAGVGVLKLTTLLAGLATGMGKIASVGSQVASAGAGVMQLAMGLQMVATAITALQGIGKVQISLPTVNVQPLLASITAGMARAVAIVVASRGALVSAVNSAVGSAVSAGMAKAGEMFNVGVMIGQGLANGMRSQIAVVASVAEELIAQANRASRAKAKIHSPSRLFAEIGDYMGQGLALGMNGTSSMVASAGAGLIDSATSSGQFGAITGGSVGSGVIGASSLTSANTSTTSADNRTFNIQPGAIVMNSTGNAKADAESLLAEIEGLIMDKDAKYLGN